MSQGKLTGFLLIGRDNVVARVHETDACFTEVLPAILQRRQKKSFVR